ncbi:alpha-amylase family glycosyl hydrolase [Polyangium sp. 6x1]|uniref:alpha-amylase family glycosyl hydrolase n=1 Tax=Polyangium sp. 6x1 TaxID=3042689 RepID=UPI0024826F02|nr:alpha-amylase family glycosyl hydrolase [Polyangium sp. 6x1]MDI1449551.1 alpha-amylase family glycosyl hydrolase [Polyangium sp. 6x1]
MRRYLGYSILGSLACVLALAAGCDGEDLNNGAGGTGLITNTGGGGAGGQGGQGGAGGSTQESFVRIHYRLQDGGDPKSWGVHFWGAGSTSPEWGSPQVFDGTDEFGVYTDVRVTVTGEADDAWLGLIPVQCTNGDCKKDVETGVRFVDLTKNAQDPNVAECWITQGQAVATKPPTAAGPAYEISRPKDFIDLGNGSVRMMFRVAKGSTGTVEYGAAADTLDKKVTWAAADDINKNGLVLTGLTPGQAVYYKISTTLDVNGQALSDTSDVLDLTPISYAPITDAADWASWGSKGLMYQLIVRTFADGGAKKSVADSKTESGIDTTQTDGIGDLVGLRNALPYIKSLADTIWMTPVFKAKSYHGYDTTDFYDIDPSLGTMKDFTDLTEAAHAAGIKIVLDLVQNHVADVNPWFIAGSDPKHADYDKYHDWFVWSDQYSNMLADGHPWDGSAVMWACKNYQCYHQIFGGPMPELNYRNPAVRAEMKKIAQHWIDLGADGFRLDASKHIDQFDDNAGISLDKHGTHVWWKEFNHFVKKDVVRPAGSAAVLLTGENRWDDPAQSGNMLPYGSDMDSQFDFPFRSIVGNFVNGQTGAGADFVGYLNKLQADLAAGANGGSPHHYLERFLSNHDLERPATQFEGAGAALDAKLKQAATIVLTVPGMPVIYYGEEFGKRGKRDKFIGNEAWDRDEFIREPMSWFVKNVFMGDKVTSWTIGAAGTNLANKDVLPFAGVGMTLAPNPDYPFVKFMSEIEPASWAAQDDDPTSLLNHYRLLIAFRRTIPVFTDLAASITLVKDTDDVYQYKLKNDAATISVVLSRKSTPQTITWGGAAEELITGWTGTSFNLPAYGVLLVQEN